jgi:oligopeptide/dipeptide ABC transporter ATP-binding protein
VGNNGHTVETLAPPTASLSTDVLSVERLGISVRSGGEDLQLVEEVSFAVRSGETVGLVGESGCGKTVTSLAVMRLLDQRIATVTGAVRLFGTDLLSLPLNELRKLRGSKIAMVFQEPRRSLNPAFTVGDQIAEVLRVHVGMSRRDAAKRAVALLDEVHIADAAQRVKQYPHEFSGGMCQRVMLAMAIACRPSVLIADEPTTALDARVQAQVLDLIDELQAHLGLAVLLITHDLAVVSERCDRAAVMYAGQIVETNATEKLFAHPRHPYTEGLIGAIAGVVAERGKLRAIRGIVPSPSAWPTGCRFHPRCDHAQPGRCDAGPADGGIGLTPCGESRTRCVRAAELTLVGVDG